MSRLERYFFSSDSALTLCLQRQTRHFPLPLVEFFSFGVREALSCLFAALFFVILALSHGLPGDILPRYDFILLASLALQFAMFAAGLESLREIKAITLFHLLGLALEIFKTHPAIHSWSYPEFAYSKVFGVPLYSGFMYAAVASYLFLAWKLLAVRLENYRAGPLTLLLALAIYLNFFTHHFIGDYRWPLIGLLMLQFHRTRVWFRPLRREFSLPLPLAFVLIGFFIWVAENLATLLGAWQYPGQAAGWNWVHLGKINSWGLLVVITFVIVAAFKQAEPR